MIGSPYKGLVESEWARVTKKLVKTHPLYPEIVDVVLETWSSIFCSKIGRKGFSIGTDIQPKPQIMGALLHELLPLELKEKYPGKWRGEREKHEKDLVCEFDPRFSVEIKTSSNASQIFGNRSYAQKAGENGPTKSKSGYYLTINFGKFNEDKGSKNIPSITRIAFGWIDHDDWSGQKAATGQQARLSPAVYAHKLIVLFAAGERRSLK